MLQTHLTIELIVYIIRGLWAVGDLGLFNMISMLYMLIQYIARVNIFTGDNINLLADRVYALLAVFMYFKLSFSLISYLVNPSKLTNETKGGSKLIINVFIGIVAIMLVPTFFAKMYDLQYALLDDKVVERFFFDEADDTSENLEYKISEICNKTSTANTSGDLIAIITFSVFYQPDDEYLKDSESREKFLDTTTGEKYCESYSDGTVATYLSPAILEGKTKGFIGLFGFDFAINYKFILSSFGGFIVVLLLVSIAIDIAVRSVKLGFLQLIAPIPIMSYMDPNADKNSMLVKWLKSVGKTWADLFIRLFAFNFGIFVIKIIAVNDNLIGDAELSGVLGFLLNGWIKFFILIGILIFMKKIPDLISDITGIKLSGGLELNPFKKIKKEALGGAALEKAGNTIKGVAVGAAMGALGASSGAGKAAALTGALSGGAEGFQNKSASAIISSQAARSDRLRAAELKGSTWDGRLREKFGKITGTGGAQQVIDEKKKDLLKEVEVQEENMKKEDDIMAPILKNIEERKKIIATGNAAHDSARSAIVDGKDQKEYVDSAGNIHEGLSFQYETRKEKVIKLENTKGFDPVVVAKMKNDNADWLENQAIFELQDRAVKDETVDYTTSGHMKMYKAQITEYEKEHKNEAITIPQTGKELKKQKGELAGRNNEDKIKIYPHEISKASYGEAKREAEELIRRYQEEEKIIAADKSGIK